MSHALAQKPAAKDALSKNYSGKYSASPKVTPAFTSVPFPVIQRCACGGGCPSCQAEKEENKVLPIQAKLRIGATNDKYEQEADRVAEQVMRIPEPSLQRQVGEEEEEGFLQTKPLLQRRAADNSSGSEVSPIVHEVLRSSGQPLDTSTRGFMESRFGHDFSQVRIHTNDHADLSTRVVNALAYTVGNHIVFRKGFYAPQTSLGHRLLIHELVHVMQARTQTADTKSTIVSPINNAVEYKAEPARGRLAKGIATLKRAPINMLLRQLDEELSPENMYVRLTAEVGFRQGVRGEDGRLLRRSSNTHAIIQLIDGEGRRIQVTFGQQVRGLHAEEHALRRLRSLLGPAAQSTGAQRRAAERLIGRQRRRFGEQAAETLRQQFTEIRERLVGGRLVVVVNQYVCEDRCQRALRDFADEYRLETVTAHVFESEGRRPRTTFHTQTHPSARAGTVQRRDAVIYHQPRRRRMQRIIRGVGGITTLLGIVFAGSTSLAHAQVADRIRASRRQERARRRVQIERNGIDLYNLQYHLPNIFEHPPLEVNSNSRNEFHLAVLNWIRRDYQEGGNGHWQRYFETELARGIRENDTDLLGVTLVNFLDGSGIDLGRLFGVRLGITERGNRQYIEDNLELVNRFLENETNYLESAAAAAELAAASRNLIQEALESYQISILDSSTIINNLRHMGNQYRNYVHTLRITRNALNQAYRVNRERWHRLDEAIAQTYERLGE